jgi:iron(III) transport system ATP-binding protein
MQLASGEALLAHVPSHHDHAVGEWVGIRAEVDHVVTFVRETDEHSEQKMPFLHIPSAPIAINPVAKISNA